MVTKQEKCAESLARKLGKKFGNCWKRKNGKNVAIKGCWKIDDNTIYGGSVIEEIFNEGGGVDHPFGPQRRKPKNFCETTRFAERTIEIKEQSKRRKKK